MNSVAESKAFIEAGRFFLETVYSVLSMSDSVIERLKNDIESLGRREKVQHRWYKNQGQWQVYANHAHKQYSDRVAKIKRQQRSAQRSKANSEELKSLLAESESTSGSMAILAGSVLQFGKQTLSYRFGREGNVPKARSRKIGSQSALHVLWCGRNHAMHWEERDRTSKSWRMIRQLKKDGVISAADLNSNNSLLILDALGWDKDSDVVNDLIKFVSFT
jgi:hypothetical protein